MTDLSLHLKSQTPFAGTFAALGVLFQTWRERRKARAELATLDPRTIKDLALSPGQIHFEAGKPFWQA